MKPERKPEDYAEPFCQFLTENPTVFHTVAAMADQLKNAGYEKLSERQEWKLKTGGKYYVERNGSSLIAFLVGEDYKPGNGAAIIAGHVDAVTVKVKPVSKVPTKAGYLQLGVAPYAGGLNSTWWDRDLGIGGRVIVQSEGKITTKLVTLNRGIARIPTLAPHFGAAANGPFNTETQMVPIIGLDDEPESDAMVDAFAEAPRTTSSCFADTQPPRLVKAVTGELGIKDPSTILDWDLELFDTQPAALGGLDKDLLFAPRIDDKICSWAAVQALLASHSSGSGIIRIAALFDNEEIGSLLRQGARGNFLPATLSRAVEALAPDAAQADLSARTAANSFLLSADVTHAANPNFLGAYLAGHAPRLNVGPAIARDPNGHMTSDGPSCALLSACVAKRGLPPLQVFQIRNDSRSGGTVGPMLSSAIGCRAIDAGIVQLSMHSIRATTGAKDPGLGVKVFEAFYGEFEKVDGEVVD
ncbi:peptidase M18, aminopeptidase I [Trichodelitschia bisporula]|uniref:Peptidase M18, aminopeptidase I n=1 Tax=Trichodelitschia bisporula TaxID=703511 RepID=A0A6G1I445_9PEZI|nr:peptidase M18, aminopeptidase I [Trichodelitschia bisporula]